MDQFYRLFSKFSQRIESLKSNNHSGYLWANECAKYEIFCLIIKQFIIRGLDQPLVNLFHLVVGQREDFFLQIIGLSHRSEQYNSNKSLDKNDLIIFTNFILAHYDGLFVLKDDKNIMSLINDYALPDLETFNKHKYDIDLALRTEIGSMLSKQTLTVTKNQVLSAISSRIVLAERQRSKLAQAYMREFGERVRTIKYYDESERHEQSNRQLKEVDCKLDELWSKVKIRLADILKRRQPNQPLQLTEKQEFKTQNIFEIPLKISKKEDNSEQMSKLKCPAFPLNGHLDKNSNLNRNCKFSNQSILKSSLENIFKFDSKFALNSNVQKRPKSP